MRTLPVLLAFVATPILAQTADSTADAPVIQDNSFLVEEAYNQESGVVQHISTFQQRRRSADFDVGIAQEWPVKSIRHQLSFDIPIARSSSSTGIGDVSLNYRYQLTGDGTTRLAVSPRISLLVPTGDWKKARGNGAAGVEVNLPVSYVISPAFVTHFNLGGGFIPSARSPLGDEANISEVSAGHSLILTVSRAIQPMVETVFARSQEVTGNDRTAWGNSTFIAPGVRAALNLESGVQIVPGIAVPIGVGSDRGTRSIFLYLSVEHGF